MKKHSEHMNTAGIVACLFAALAIFATLHEASWSVIMTYALTAVTIMLAGKLADRNEPQEIEVLLRHSGTMWLLTVLRAPNGRIYAPYEKEKRLMRQVSSAFDLPRDILGCPHFSYIGSGFYMILDQEYGIAESEEDYDDRFGIG